jgi:hypothetical protein
VWSRICLLSPDGHGGGLSGSRLLLDKTVRTGLASTTRHEFEGTRTSKDDFLSTQARVYLPGHVTAKGTAELWLWALLWTPLWGLPPRLQRTSSA